MTDEELRSRLDGMVKTQAEMAKTLAALEERVGWFFTIQPGDKKTPVQSFVETTQEWERAKFAARLSRYGLASIIATIAVLSGWWRDILDFARAANGGK